MRDHEGWHSYYRKAMLETDPDTQKQYIDDALRAIDDRKEDSLHGRTPLQSEERHEIDDATRLLRFLKEHPLPA